MSFYEILVLVHVLAAILGIGPGFILTITLTKAETMTELRHAFRIRHRLHRFVMIGGLLLFITGFWMGIIHPYLFREGWYIVSILLFLIVLASGPIFLAPITKPIKKMLADSHSEEIPPDYFSLSKRLYLLEHLTNALLLIIIILMVMKPF